MYVSKVKSSLNKQFDEKFFSVIRNKTLVIIMLSVIFSLYIRYTTMVAHCTDIHVILLFHVYTMSRPGIVVRESGGGVIRMYKLY